MVYTFKFSNNCNGKINLTYVGGHVVRIDIMYII